MRVARYPASTLCFPCLLPRGLQSSNSLNNTSFSACPGFKFLKLSCLRVSFNFVRKAIISQTILFMVLFGYCLPSCHLKKTRKKDVRCTERLSKLHEHRECRPHQWLVLSSVLVRFFLTKDTASAKKFQNSYCLPAVTQHRKQ